MVYRLGRQPKTGDRRIFPRINKSFTLYYSIEHVAHKENLPKFIGHLVDITQTKDLCEGGLAFTGSFAIPLQTALRLRLQIPTQRRAVEFEACVTDCNKIKKDIVYRIGVKLINLDSEKKKLLHQLVQLFLKA